MPWSYLGLERSSLGSVGELEGIGSCVDILYQTDKYLGLKLSRIWISKHGEQKIIIIFFCAILILR